MDDPPGRRLDPGFRDVDVVWTYIRKHRGAPGSCTGSDGAGLGRRAGFAGDQPAGKRECAEMVEPDPVCVAGAGVCLVPVRTAGSELMYEFGKALFL